jgi:hypothetical protein
MVVSDRFLSMMSLRHYRMVRMTSRPPTRITARRTAINVSGRAKNSRDLDLGWFKSDVPVENVRIQRSDWSQFYCAILAHLLRQDNRKRFGCNI